MSKQKFGLSRLNSVCTSSLDNKCGAHGRTPRQTVRQNQAGQSKTKLKYGFLYKRDRTLKFNNLIILKIDMGSMVTVYNYNILIKFS